MGEHRLAGGSVIVHAEFGDGSEDGCVGVHASSVPRSTTSLVPILVPAKLICRVCFQGAGRRRSGVPVADGDRDTGRVVERTQMPMTGRRRLIRSICSVQAVNVD
jgi:hypothetical protein